MRFRVAVILVALLAGSSFHPQHASAVDRVGLYFDTVGAAQCQDVVGGLPVTVYVILEDPTFQRLYGWEASVQSAQGVLFLMGSSLPVGGVNSGSGTEFHVEYSEPLTLGPKTVLAALTLLPISPETCLVLTGVSPPSLPVFGPIVWSSADTANEIATSDALASGVDAIIGGCSTIPENPPHIPCAGVVAVLRTNWGALKSTYR